MTPDVYLKIFTNSTRKIRWDAKLGFQKNPGNLIISLNSILPDGGPISRLDVIIVRIYPFLYVEKTVDGRRVVRNEKTEEKAEAEHKKIRDEKLEKIYDEVYAEMRRSKKKTRDTDDVLSPEIEKNFYSLTRNFHRENQNKDNTNGFEALKKVEEKLKRENLKRDVSQVLKIRIADARKPNFTIPSLLSIWNPNEETSTLFAEGKGMSLVNVTVSNFQTRFKSGIQINASRSTRFQSITNRDFDYPARRLTPLGKMADVVFDEIDIVGIVTVVKDFTEQDLQIIYLSDLEFNFVGISFRGGCQNYGWENILKRSEIVACSNLSLKSTERSSVVPTVWAKETSSFTKNSKKNHLKKGLETLKGNLPREMDKFLHECEGILSEKLEMSKISGYSFGCNDDSVKDVDLSTSTSSSLLSSSKQMEKNSSSSKYSNNSFRWISYKNV
ncbi:hypothetical protein Phum_PHUM580740 [Pediculus humanus corporis]|uniref:Tower domain-containing protein n=1 Tax=Pediculus humanus subsp. corporis TaxID=121224 RepID=E0W1Z1_PEDHC|nr:uncharacterized protein Phum_PHUM580740 [Pediculus humanus corporis]EEB19585.1 hypothetical protein Phum_PHUM580740 [Pediculus humanus corporis]